MYVIVVVLKKKGVSAIVEYMASYYGKNGIMMVQVMVKLLDSRFASLWRELTTMEGTKKDPWHPHRLPFSSGVL